MHAFVITVTKWVDISVRKEVGFEVRGVILGFTKAKGSSDLDGAQDIDRAEESSFGLISSDTSFHMSLGSFDFSILDNIQRSVALIFLPPCLIVTL